jgi:hypothetical protein
MPEVARILNGKFPRDAVEHRSVGPRLLYEVSRARRKSQRSKFRHLPNNHGRLDGRGVKRS